MRTELRYCRRCDELTERTASRECRVCRRRRDRDRKRERYTNDPEYREMVRARMRVENLTPERIEHNRAYMRKYHHTFAGVIARHRYEERKALERINRQIEEVL